MLTRCSHCSTSKEDVDESSPDRPRKATAQFVAKRCRQEHNSRSSSRSQAQQPTSGKRCTGIQRGRPAKLPRTSRNVASAHLPGCELRRRVAANRSQSDQTQSYKATAANSLHRSPAFRCHAESAASCVCWTREQKDEPASLRRTWWNGQEQGPSRACHSDLQQAFKTSEVQERTRDRPPRDVGLRLHRPGRVANVRRVPREISEALLARAPATAAAAPRLRFDAAAVHTWPFCEDCSGAEAR